MNEWHKILIEIRDGLYKNNPEVDVFWVSPFETLEDRVESIINPIEDTQQELPL